MDIRSPSEFYGFIKNFGLSGLCPEIQRFVVCMEEFGRMCNCESANAKTVKQNQCKELYINFASRSGNYKSQLISKINDGRLFFFNGSTKLN